MPAGSSGIVKLPQEVIDRIAAGEVVQRPSAALKELLENSIDAGADHIHVTAGDGGLSVLQIRDNGSGIHRDDLPLLCERFATSKLRSFEELQSVATFGFRGEALASLSHVAHVSVTTMTADADVAWEASYAAGAMIEGPTAAAGNKGTVLIARDMFYNAPTRRRAFANPAEEFAKICDVVTRYAMARPDITFVVQKVGATRLDVSLPKLPPSVADRRDPRGVVRARFGEAVSRHLVQISAASSPATDTATDDAEAASEKKEFRVDGWVSGLKFSTGKRAHFTLFVNGRLVASAPLQRATDHAYAPFLVGSAKPFVFLSVTVPAADVDVNVHPTKSEVLLLHEDAVVAATYRAVRAVLLAQHEAGPREIGSSGAAPTQTQGAGLASDAAAGIAAASAQRRATAGGAPPPAAQAGGGSGGPSVMKPVVRERGAAERGALLKFAVPARQFELDADRAATPAAPAAAAALPSTKAAIDVDDSAADPAPSKAHRSESSLNAAAPQPPRPVVATAAEAPSAAPSLSAMLAAAAADDDDDDDDDGRQRLAALFRPSETQQATPQQSSRNQIGDADIVVSSSTSSSDVVEHDGLAAENGTVDPGAATEPLTSVVAIQAGHKGASNDFITRFARHARFVGAVDEHRILVQSQTTLYVVAIAPLLRCAAEQRVLSAWGRLPRYRLRPAADGAGESSENPLSVRSMIHFAATHDAGVAAQVNGSAAITAELAAAVEAHLRRWAPMLAEYFGVEFDDTNAANGLALRSLPAPLGTTFPLRARALPLLVLRLGVAVDYGGEESAFAGIARELGLFAAAAAADADATALREAVAGSVAIDAFAPPVALASDGHMQAIVTVEALYKVFERC